MTEEYRETPAGWNVISVGTAGSTNALAMEMGEKGAPHGTVVVADRQTSGRGRLGRSWSSPAGNLFMSILLRPPSIPSDASLLTLAAAVACSGALRDTAGLRVEIKWPNDLMVSGRKLGGILAETKSRGKTLSFVVLGIGINLNSRAADLSPELEAAATSVRDETGREFPRSVLVPRILREISLWCDELSKGNRARVLDEWRRLSCTLGKQVRVTAGNEVFEGLAQEIDGEGRLIVQVPPGVLRVVNAGDVTLVR